MNLLSLLLPLYLWMKGVVGHVYSDTWAVHIEGGRDRAVEVIEQHGFTYLDEIMPDHYHVRHHKVSKRSIHPHREHHDNLASHPEVRWLEQQVIKSRKKRDLQKSFNDPKYPRMWYLWRASGLDMNVQHAWDKNITGRNVVVSILDDGIEKDHPDLKKNYDAHASYDVNGHDPDPQPRYDYTNENRHGTRCAGEVAAQANNRICSVGVAYDARIGGVRMLDGDVTDAVEAQSLSLNPQHIDIYSASWGPDDDGKTVDGPATLARKAFQNGIDKGRGGKGSIFVWASGNGGRDHDSCNCDGYTNSIYTVSISSTTENGHIPWYSEACSSTLATTYSSGSGGERQIVTTDLRKGCTESHTGTSASAPLAAGICALVLQANPNLTWRDLQHIVVKAARPANLRTNDWVTNGVGRKVSHSFGYGLMDASLMVDYALNWTNVPAQHKCTITAPIAPSRGVPVYSQIRVSLESDGCRDERTNEVLYLEHVQSIITLTSSRRGQVRIRLTSPQGTTSTLLQRRVKDNSVEGFDKWAFMTTHNWGEISRGTWVLEVENGESTSTELKAWTLVLYGTATHPQSSKGQSPVEARPQAGLECSAGQFMLNNFCYDSCPKHFYETKIVITEAHRETGNDTTSPNTTSTNTSVPTHRNVCLECHVLCAGCDGPDSDNCLSCVAGFELINKTCVHTALLTVKNLQPVKLAMIAVLLCLISVLLFLAVFIALQIRDGSIPCHFCNGSKKPKYVDISKNQYNGVRLQSTDKSLLESESDSEDEFDADFKSDMNGGSLTSVMS